MAKVKLLGDLEHDGTRYEKGQTFEGDKELTDHLIQIGTAQDPKAAKEAEDGAEDHSEARGAEIVAKAQQEAEVTTKAAQEAADKVVAAAKAEAEKTVSDAKAQAKADGEDIVKAAQEQATKIVEDAKAEAEKVKTAAKPVK